MRMTGMTITTTTIVIIIVIVVVVRMSEWLCETIYGGTRIGW